MYVIETLTSLEQHVLQYNSPAPSEIILCVVDSNARGKSQNCYTNLFTYKILLR